jgi:hypothetical protein
VLKVTWFSQLFFFRFFFRVICPNSQLDMVIAYLTDGKGAIWLRCYCYFVDLEAAAAFLYSFMIENGKREREREREKECERERERGGRLRSRARKEEKDVKGSYQSS